MNLLKLFLFHLLLSLRSIVLVISKLLAIAFFTTTALINFFSHFDAVKTTAGPTTLLFGILFLLVFWTYDYVIFFFKPKMFNLVLIK